MSDYAAKARRDFERSAEQHTSAFLTWKAARESKLAAMAPEIANEILITAWERIKAGAMDPQLSHQERRDAEKRVISRLRLKAFGPIEDTAVDEWLRQTNEIRARLGLSHVMRPTPKAAA